jgi:hypothetical protein
MQHPKKMLHLVNNPASSSVLNMVTKGELPDSASRAGGKIIKDIPTQCVSSKR